MENRDVVQICTCLNEAMKRQGNEEAWEPRPGWPTEGYVYMSQCDTDTVFILVCRRFGIHMYLQNVIFALYDPDHQFFPDQNQFLDKYVFF